VHVFARKGYGGTSVQEIADAAGIRKASVYKHVSTKEDLLFDVLDAVHAQSAALMEEVSTLDLRPIDRLHEYLRRHVLWYLADIDLVAVFFREWDALTSPDRRALVAERRRGYDRFLRELVVACQEAGEADPELAPKYASFYVLGAVNRIPDWFAKVENGASAEEVAIEAADVAVRIVGVPS
jgi:AcrR family transcriptional regulator